MKGLTSIVAASVAYAALRYNVFAKVAWTDFPLYVSNKGLALASVILIAASYVVNRWMTFEVQGSGRVLARQAGMFGFSLAAAHVVASLMLIAPLRYPRLFEGSDLSASGAVCLIAGGLAMAVLCLPAAYSIEAWLPVLGRANWKRGQRAGYAALALTAVHIPPVGVSNWLAPEMWPGGLPPISMISFVVCLVPLALKLAQMRSGETKPSVSLSALPPTPGHSSSGPS